MLLPPQCNIRYKKNIYIYIVIIYILNNIIVLHKMLVICISLFYGLLHYLYFCSICIVKIAFTCKSINRVETGLINVFT